MGYETDNVASSAAAKREAWGWQAFLLPYLEHASLYDQLNVEGQRLENALKAAKTDAPLRALLQSPIGALRCPSDNAEDTTLDPDNRHFYGAGNSGGKKFAVGLSNYPGVVGLYDRPWEGDGPYRNNGMFFGNSRIRIRLLKDGTSKTFMIGERDSRCFASSWPGVRNPPGPCNWGMYHALGRVSFKLNSHEDKPYQELNGGWDSCNSCTEGFSSSHPGGAMFAYADGSVHFIPDDVEYNNGGLSRGQIKNGKLFKGEELGLYQKFGIRNDAQAVDMDL